MLSQAESAQGLRDRKMRQHLMERSFGHGTRYGIKQARWRRLWRVAIQEYLTATIQNIGVLIRYLKEPRRAGAKMLSRTAVDRPGSRPSDSKGITAPGSLASFMRHIVEHA